MEYFLPKPTYRCCYLHIYSTLFPETRAKKAVQAHSNVMPPCPYLLRATPS